MKITWSRNSNPANELNISAMFLWLSKMSINIDQICSIKRVIHTMNILSTIQSKVRGIEILNIFHLISIVSHVWGH